MPAEFRSPTRLLQCRRIISLRLIPSTLLILFVILNLTKFQTTQARVLQAATPPEGGSGDDVLRFSQHGRQLFSDELEDSRTIYKNVKYYSHPDQGQPSASIGEHGPPTATSVYNFWDTFNITAAMSTSKAVLTLGAKHLDTADEFEIVLMDGNLTDYNGFFNDLSAFYDFMNKALSVAMPVPDTGSISGDEAAKQSSDISCVTWLADDHSAIYIDAKLMPVYSFLPPLSVSLELPRVRNGTTEQRQQRTLEKLTSEFRESLAEQGRQFREALAEQGRQSREALAEQGRQFSATMDPMIEVVDMLRMQASNRIAFRGGYTLPMDVETVVVANSSISFQNSAINSPDDIYPPAGSDNLVLTRAELDKASTTSYTRYYYSNVSPMFYLVADRLGRVPQQIDRLGRVPQQWALTQGGLLPSNITSDELRPLTLCTNITYLDLSHAKLTHLDFLPSLKKLETLVLRGASKLTDLEPLRGLHNLRKLDISDCSKLEDVSVLNELPSLENVDLTGTAVINKLALTNPRLAITGL